MIIIDYRKKTSDFIEADIMMIQILIRYTDNMLAFLPNITLKGNLWLSLSLLDMILPYNIL